MEAFTGEGGSPKAITAAQLAVALIQIWLQPKSQLCSLLAALSLINHQSQTQRI
jgi:hypothetical protein